MTKHISCDCKCKFNSITCNSKQKRNNTSCQCECKNNHRCEKDYSLNPNTCICENSTCLKSGIDTSVTNCDKIVIAMNNLSIKKTNSITTNVTTIALINCHRLLYFAYSLLYCKSRRLLYFTYSFISDHVTIHSYLIKHQARHLLPFHK